MTRFGTALTTGVLALALVLGASPAHAADEIGVAWDPSQPASNTLDRPVFQDIRAVPGDTGTRSFIAINRGEMAATLVASIVDVTVTGDPDEQWYQDFTINAIPVHDLLGNVTPILTVPLSVTDFAEINLTYDFPESASSGNYGVDEPPVTVAFQVRLEMSGETRISTPTATPTPTVTPTPSDSPTPSGTPTPTSSATTPPTTVVTDPPANSQPPVASPSGPLAFTGTTGAATIVGGGILLLALGAGLRATVLRRRQQVETE